MANFYADNADIRFHLDHMDLDRLVRLRERDFEEAAQYDYAPTDVADALDNYRRTMDLVGDIAGNVIAPLSPDIDTDGSHLCPEDGRVRYAPGIVKALKALSQADLMGMTLPRRFGGLNFPGIIYAVATEIVSRADASLMNIFGLMGYLMKRYKFEGAPLILALVLGPMLENSLRRSLMMSEGSMGIFFTRPISLVFMVVSLAFLISPLFTRERLGKTAIETAEE